MSGIGDAISMKRKSQKIDITKIIKKKPWYSTTRSKIAPIIKVVSCIITSGSIITRILMRNYCMVNPYTKRTCAHIQPKNNRHKND